MTAKRRRSCWKCADHRRWGIGAATAVVVILGTWQTILIICDWPLNSIDRFSSLITHCSDRTVTRAAQHNGAKHSKP